MKPSQSDNIHFHGLLWTFQWYLIHYYGKQEHGLDDHFEYNLRGVHLSL